MSIRHQRLRFRIGALLASALAATGVVALSAGPAAAAATGGAGATLPYVEVQAENSSTNGTVIGPSAVYGTLPAEASYRKAVTLQGTGKYVEFTTPVATNSIVFRYSIPDSAGGSVYTAPLSFYVNGAKQPDFTLTNAYSWYYGGYPFTNSPGSNPHHFYDEAHRLLPATYPAGTTFRLQVDSGDTASSYTIDFADFENVAAALSQPSGSVSVTGQGADPTGASDSTAAFNAAISAAGAGGTVWIPEGTFKIPGHLILSNVTIKGAGMWRSTIVGAAPGLYGDNAPTGSTGVHLSDFAIFGDVQERNDSAQVNGIGGALNNSTVDRVWIEHMKVGAWMDGPMNNLVFTGMRIRDVTADGVNFHDGVTASKVTGSDLRNLGDDGLATWSDTNADAGDSFDHDTVQYPILANGIAIYGGHDNTVSDNRVIDAGLTQGGGIHVAQRFASTPLGRTDVLRNTIIRSGSLDPNWNFGVGALWFDARDAAMSGQVNVDNLLIQQSPFEAIQFVSGSSITNVSINNATIQNTGTWVVQEQVGGSATITNSTATGTQAPAPIYNCGVGFTLTDGGGNSGIFSPAAQCQNITNPAFPPYVPDNGSQISISPSAVGFGSVAVGSTSAAQSVTVTNSGTAAAPVGSIATSGDFGQTNTCGSSIAAGASCTVSVKFTPTAAGSRTGSLTVTAAGAANTVALSGTGIDGTTNLARGRTATASSSVNGTFVPANATDGDAGTYWESANNAFPQWLQVDLGATYPVGTVTLKLPPSWGTRTQTLSVLGSTNGTDFSTLAGPATYTFTSPSNVVNIPVSSANARYVRVAFTANSGWPAGQASELEVYTGTTGTTPPPPGDLAQGKATSESSHTDVYASSNATDGNQGTYWESANNAFPQWLQVDLGSPQSITKIVLQLPASWGARTQTLSVTGSTDGSTFTTLKPSAAYTFDPASTNTVTIPLTTTQRFVRLTFTANTGWPAGQISGFQVWNT